MQPGNEILASSGLYSGNPWPLSRDWFRYVVYNDPNWDASTFDLSSAALAEQLNPFDVRTWPIDNASGLPAFRERGGKIITFHGGQDQQITTFDTSRWYDALARGTSSTSAELDEWLRFFRISGMSHCSGGPGAWVLGQGGNAAAEGVPFEPEKNVLAALVAWVEQDQAPITMEGTKFKDDKVGEGNLSVQSQLTRNATTVVKVGTCPVNVPLAALGAVVAGLVAVAVAEAVDTAEAASNATNVKASVTLPVTALIAMAAAAAVAGEVTEAVVTVVVVVAGVNSVIVARAMDTKLLIASKADNVRRQGATTAAKRAISLVTVRQMPRVGRSATNADNLAISSRSVPIDRQTENKWIRQAL
ncbi:MAG: hypothetical protein Q9160_007825 [Pyrenula sp. 1 TL-2023]